ncbi:protein-cysteine S-palmitoyltransferase [Aureococcus anophagefferens]|nr:protein-cysteine S-palmitoyltransferase [Aureococcus anophagefferens]
MDFDDGLVFHAAQPRERKRRRGAGGAPAPGASRKPSSKQRRVEGAGSGGRKPAAARRPAAAPASRKPAARPASATPARRGAGPGPRRRSDLDRRSSLGGLGAARRRVRELPAVPALGPERRARARGRRRRRGPRARAGPSTLSSSALRAPPLATLARARDAVEAALGNFGDACRAAVRGALDGARAEAAGGGRWRRRRRLRAIQRLAALERDGEAAAAALARLEAEAAAWRAAPAGDAALAALRGRRGAGAAAATTPRMEDDLRRVHAVAGEARRADAALLSATAAQRELYTAYDQAQFRTSGRPRPQAPHPAPGRKPADRGRLRRSHKTWRRTMAASEHPLISELEACLAALDGVDKTIEDRSPSGAAVNDFFKALASLETVVTAHPEVQFPAEALEPGCDWDRLAASTLRESLAGLERCERRKRHADLARSSAGLG